MNPGKSSHRPLSDTTRLGLIGLGTVGGGVAEILAKHQDLIVARSGASMEIVRAAVRDVDRVREGAAHHVRLTTKIEDIVSAPDVDIVVELMGGVDAAYKHIRRALENGKPVVTANKAVLAQHGPELYAIAAAHGVDVYFEAAVAGGIPIIRTMREGLAADRITAVRGILNGTTNFVLGLMGEGQSYGEALAEAQRRGYAESDPTIDVNGRDAADKLTILAHLAYGVEVRPQDFPVVGIESLTPEVLRDAHDLGFAVKLLGIAKRVGSSRAMRLDLRVHPTFVPLEHQLASVPGAQNAISVVSDALGQTLYQGPGAGGMPTGSAVVSDLIEAARSLRLGVSGRVKASRKAAMALVDPADARACFYLRFLVDDKPGVLAAITRILADHKISLETVLQRSRCKIDGDVPLLLVTHETTQGAVDAAIQEVKKLRTVRNGHHHVPIMEVM